MDYVGAVETLAEVHKQLGRNQLFGGKHPRLDTKYHRLGAAIDPRLVNRDDSIAHARDEIDIVSVAVRFGQPYWITYLDFEALFRKMLKRLGHGLRRKKKIEVLSVAPNASVLLQRKCACDDVRQVYAVQVTEHFTAECAHLWREVRMQGGTDR